MKHAPAWFVPGLVTLLGGAVLACQLVGLRLTHAPRPSRTNLAVQEPR